MCLIKNVLTSILKGNPTNILCFAHKKNNLDETSAGKVIVCVSVYITY